MNRKTLTVLAGLILGQMLAVAQPGVVSPLTIKSSASYTSGVAFARNMIVFGETPAVSAPLAIAGDTWPTELGGVRVQITDSSAQILLAPIYFVAPGQVGFLIPSNAATGTAGVQVISSTGTGSANIEIGAVQPGLYTSSSTGSGVAAGLWIRVDSGDHQTYDYLFGSQGTPTPVDLGGATDKLYLSIYGTGFRAASSATATVGGVSVPVSGFAAVSYYPGLDLVNVGPIPRSLIGRSQVDVLVSFDGKPANAVTVTLR
jgi:uncharacterized protein (TIGR03437 family)